MIARARPARATRSSCSPTERCPATLPENCRVGSSPPRPERCRGLRFEAALGRESCAQPAGRGARAHVPDLRRPRRAARPARPGSACCSGTRTGERRDCSGSPSGSRRSSSPSTGARSRSPRARCAASATASTWRVPCHERAGQRPPARARARRYSPAKGYETLIRAARRAGDPADRARARARRTRSGGTARSSRSLAGARSSCSTRSRAPRSRRCSRARTSLLNNIRTGTADKVVYEACASCVPAFASAASFASLLPDQLRFAREDDEGLADALVAFAGAAGPTALQLGRDLRGKVERGHSVESWADGVRRGGTMTILHVQKVSGISGSEAHLLSLLPLLRARGWDARMLVLHEGEPGAAAFVEAMAAKNVPVTQLRLRLDLDPVAFPRSSPVLIRRRPAVLHTHLVHADLYGLTAGALARVPVRSAPSTASTSFGPVAGWPLPTAPSAGSRAARSRSRAGSPPTWPRSKASTARGSTSSITGSRPGRSRRRTRARLCGCSRLAA